MAGKEIKDLHKDQFSEAVATAIQFSASCANSASQTLRSTANNVATAATVVGEAILPVALQLMEQGTETVGKIITPIALNPFIRYAAKVPGINIFLTALGHIDLEQAQQEVDKLRQEYPLETREQLAHRIIVDAALKAGGVGLVTHFVPPLALTLFAIDLAAITTLQAEMVYRIAAAYGFSLQDPSRRGEVLAVFGLSVGGSGALKVGLGLAEITPLVGTVVGASSNAALLYSLGYAACQFYEAKKNNLKSKI